MPLRTSKNKTSKEIFLLVSLETLVAPAFLEPIVLGSGNFRILQIIILNDNEPMR